MLSHEELENLIDAKAKVYGSDGAEIGTLGRIHRADGTGLPDFVTVHTGFLGSAENFVPIDTAEISNGQLYVKFPKVLVRDAPNIDPTAVLSEEDKDLLYEHYAQAGVGHPGIAAAPSPRQAKERAGSAGGNGPFAGGEPVVRDDVSADRVPLRKYVVTERGTHGSSSAPDRMEQPVHPVSEGWLEEHLEETNERPQNHSS